MFNVLRAEVEAACRLEGDFLLRSGQRSEYYFDKYLFEANPKLLREICSSMLHGMVVDFDYFAGLEMGGIPIAIVLSQMTDIPTLFVRKEAKEYGTAKLAEGPDLAGKTLTVIEDVITTGGQVVKSVNDLRERGATVNNVMCVILRNEEGRKNLDASELNLYNLFDFT